jgi:hypothetical protein
MAVADPEFEDVAEQDQGADLSVLGLQKLQQPAVIGVLGVKQVGIGDENISHGGQL